MEGIHIKYMHEKSLTEHTPRVCPAGFLCKHGGLKGCFSLIGCLIKAARKACYVLKILFRCQDSELTQSKKYVNYFAGGQYGTCKQ